MAVRIHTIPVPQGWSAEQAWEHYARGNKLTEEERKNIWWANVLVANDERFLHFIGITQ